MQCETAEIKIKWMCMCVRVCDCYRERNVAIEVDRQCDWIAESFLRGKKQTSWKEREGKEKKKHKRTQKRTIVMVGRSHSYFSWRNIQLKQRQNKESNQPRNIARVCQMFKYIQESEREYLFIIVIDWLLFLLFMVFSLYKYIIEGRVTWWMICSCYFFFITFSFLTFSLRSKLKNQIFK